MANPFVECKFEKYSIEVSLCNACLSELLDGYLREKVTWKARCFHDKMLIENMSTESMLWHGAA
jgi:hypothetical protein